MIQPDFQAAHGSMDGASRPGGSRQKSPGPAACATQRRAQGRPRPPVIIGLAPWRLIASTTDLLAFADLHVLSGFMYVGLGWLVVVSLPALLRGLDTAETVLVVAGGLLYSFGALALATNRPNPWPRTFGYHEVWHAATIAAAACQYASVLLVVLGLPG